MTRPPVDHHAAPGPTVADHDPVPVQMVFDENGLLPELFGDRDQNLVHLERQLGVCLTPRGNHLSLSGPASAVARAQAILGNLYDRLKRGQPVDQAEIDAGLRITGARQTQDMLPLWQETAAIKTRKRQITARSVTQSQYIKALRDHALVFGLGPAGTGKTYLAVAAAVDMLMTGQVQRIILSRPAVEAGERLGFLPGDLKEKVDPYLRPLYDALHDMLPGDQVIKRMTSGEIEVAPLAFMRGRTLAHSFVILDEAQNTTTVQMKMFLTRLGEGSRMAVTGDLSQIDLPPGIKSGLADALDTLQGVEGVGFVHFQAADVVRHPLVMRIVHAYERRDRDRAAQKSHSAPVIPTAASS